MARTAAVLLLLVAAAALAAPATEDKYSSRYDHVDLDALLSNPGQLGVVLKCFQSDSDDGCGEMSKRVKAVLPEALPGDCARCTDKQRGGLAKVVGFLAKSKPEAWKALQAKYDPQGAYAAKHPELFQ